MLELSPFRLSVFRQCRRKYKFHYVDGLYKQYGRPRPYFTMGANVHWVLSSFLKGSTPSERRTFDYLERLLRQRWGTNRKGFASDDEEREWGLRALRQLKGFFEGQDILTVPRMTEAVHKAPLTSHLRLMGKIDRVDDVDGGLAVIDYKTGKRPMVPDLLQLRAYALILLKRFNQPVVSARYLYLEGGGTTEIRPDEDELAEAEAELIVAGEEMLSENQFSPAPNRLCQYCDFLTLCPDGRAYQGTATSLEEDEEEED